MLETISPLTLEASLQAAQSYETAQRETTHALRLQIQQVEYEAARAFAQYDQADPKHRLVSSQLESRWNAKFEELAQLQEQLHALQAAVTPLAEADRQMIMALGHHLRELWFSDDCSMALKKQSIRILIREIMVSLDEDTQDVTFTMHWQSGCHTTMSMKKPLSSAIKYKTPEQDIALLRNLSVRCDDGVIARVLSKLGRTTVRGKRWHQTRVAYTRKQYGIPAADKEGDYEDIIRLMALPKRWRKVTDPGWMSARAQPRATALCTSYCPIRVGPHARHVVHTRPPVRGTLGGAALAPYQHPSGRCQGPRL